MQTVIGVVTVQNKKHQYSLSRTNQDLIHIKCDAANIEQDFLAEDVADLLIDLPNLIVAEKAYQAKQSDVVRFRVTPEIRQKIEQKASQKGFKSISEYLRHMALQV